MRIIIEPVSDAEKLILGENAITYNELLILSGKSQPTKRSWMSDDDYKKYLEKIKEIQEIDKKDGFLIDGLIKQYLTHKKFFIVKNVKNIKNNIKMFNKIIEIANQRNIFSDLDGSKIEEINIKISE